MSENCTNPGSFHTADTTWWFHLAYGTPRLRLYRFIPHRLMARTCPTWAAR